MNEYVGPDLLDETREIATTRETETACLLFACFRPRGGAVRTFVLRPPTTAPPPRGAGYFSNLLTSNYTMDVRSGGADNLAVHQRLGAT